jgi:glycosyltransferase involved in cell wall biosynthesis
MKFSIVITTYNRLALLKRAIDSSLSQSIPCQVVVADDCSSDGTEDYVLALQHKLHARGDLRLVYQRNDTNIGHSATMNAGVNASDGDWIKPLDDDDYLAANCIEEMLSAIARHPQAAICSCQAAQVDAQEVELSRTPRTGPGKAFYIPQEDIHYGMLLDLVPFGTPVQVSFRRDAFCQAGGWDSDLDGNCDDIDSWIKLTRFGDAIFLNQCLAYRTIWQGAYNRKFPVLKRLDTNILMKQRIYALVHPKYRDTIPPLEDVQNYLQLHWGFVAIKQGLVLAGLELVLPVLLCFPAWLLLIKAILFRKHPWLNQYAIVSRLPIDRAESADCQKTPPIAPSEFEDRRNDLHLSWGWQAFKTANFQLGSQLTQPSIASWFKRQVRGRDSTEYSHFDRFPAEVIQANFGVVETLFTSIDRQAGVDAATLKTVRAYLKLRGGWMTWKNGNPIAAVQVALPVLLHLPGWRMLFATVETERQQRLQNSIRRFVLIDERSE